MNTKIEYLYRDADNYKAYNSCVISGELTQDQIDTLVDCLMDGEYFVPRMVGLPEKKFETYAPETDHPYFELDENCFTPTDAAATVRVTAAELVDSFMKQKGKWHFIERDRALELLGLLINDKVNSEDCKALPVIERLAELGFSEVELLALNFSQGDINDAFAKEDNEDV